MPDIQLGTPHIAGYSIDGQYNATMMTLKSLCDFFQINLDIDSSLPENIKSLGPSDKKDNILSCYNPKNDYNILIAHPEDFEKIRGNYNLRKE